MTDAKTEKPAKDQRHIQSIEVGFRLIHILEHTRGTLPLKVLAERADMPASKAHLYLVSFAKIGLVFQDTATMRYGLGPYSIQLGMAGLRQLDVVEASMGPMQALQERHALSVYLSVWGNFGPTIVRKFDSDMEMPVEIKVGYVLPLLNSATGRVFAASLAPAVVKATLKRRDVQYTDEDLEKIRERFTTTRIAMSDSRVFEGFAALSTSIVDFENKIAATMTVLGLRSRVELDLGGPLATDLLEAAAEVSAMLGRQADGDSVATMNKKV